MVENASFWANGLHTPAVRITSVGILSLLCIVGTCGHFLHILTLLKINHYHQHCRCLLINISVVSLLCNGINIPIYLVNVVAGEQYYLDPFCLAIGYFSSFTFVALMANCLTIAVDRCCATNPSAKIQSRQRTRLTIAFLWIIPGVLALCGVPFLGYNGNQLHCIYEEHKDINWFSKILVAVPTTCTFVIISACYIRICHKVNKSRRNILSFKPKPTQLRDRPSPVVKPRRLSTSVPNLRDTNGSFITLADLRDTTFSQSMISLRDRIMAWSDTHEKELRLTLQLLVNFTLFVLLWLPLTVLYFLEGSIQVSPDTWLAFSVLARVYAAINWAMYSLWSKPVRHAFLTSVNSVCRCCFKSYAQKRRTRVESIRIMQEQVKTSVKRLPPKRQSYQMNGTMQPVASVPDLTDSIKMKVPQKSVISAVETSSHKMKP